MTQKAIDKAKLVYYTLEHILGPILVFLTCYLHHLYFADDFVSSFFAGFALVSLLMVMALEKFGLYCATVVQLAFLGWIYVAGPQELMQQALFSSALAISLLATYINTEPAKPVVEAPQKDRRWQELFDARQEIKTLYQQKLELENGLEDKVRESCQERDEKLLFVKHHLEAVMLEKAQLVEAKQHAEDDIKKLLDNMHEMALKLEQAQKQQPQQSEPPQKDKEQDLPAASVNMEEVKYEGMYRQLKLQFEEKAQILDDTRKQLFTVEEELECYKREKLEQLEATDEERALMKQLVASDNQLETLKKKHAEELIGYEEVIQGLLTQLQEKNSK